MTNVISVKNLVKEYRVPAKKKHSSSIFSFSSRHYDLVRALDGISFNARKGDIVGYVGLNGAGKSTTIKILCGILTPTSGDVDVLGFCPYEQRYRYSYQISAVFGHRTLLWWDIAVIESLKLYKDIYEISDERFKEKIGILSETLEIQDLLHIPPRMLSLGQRMRCELAASLVNDPQILFLDEPTIGLDIILKAKIRRFLLDINKNNNVTIFLATHDMNDVEELCNCIKILDRGRIIYDGELLNLRSTYDKYKLLELRTAKKNKILSLPKGCVVLKEGTGQITIRVDTETCSIHKIVKLLSKFKVGEISIRNLNLEPIVKEIYLNLRSDKNEFSK